ncbi:hypothetical protein IHE45_05G115600 [Dioscorea alata]|uniref:Uncharacterized protein n=1 Tax=Dioscorea alata TaxID=55571 RepID=A0ACB7W4M0_DIOAL|nr:hypothetical protein IHE45_05G115600 [Dioscorea alata]
MGTPCATLSSVKFHPQWDKNPPVAPCANTCSCGTHDCTTKPTCLVLSRNPSGKNPTGSSMLVELNYWALDSMSDGVRTTHRNLYPLISNPQANSFIWPHVSVPTLPNDTYSTDLLGCLSSQDKQLTSSMSGEQDWISGPTK